MGPSGTLLLGDGLQIGQSAANLPLSSRTPFAKTHQASNKSTQIGGKRALDLVGLLFCWDVPCMASRGVLLELGRVTTTTSWIINAKQKETATSFSLKQAMCYDGGEHKPMQHVVSRRRSTGGVQETSSSAQYKNVPCNGTFSVLRSSQCTLAYQWLLVSVGSTSPTVGVVDNPRLSLLFLCDL